MNSRMNETETTFRRNPNLNQWFWHTQSANGEIVATGGEGYVSLEGAINGFLSQQGYPQWTQDHDLPQGFTGIRVNPNEYIIEKTNTNIETSTN